MARYSESPSPRGDSCGHRRRGAAHHDELAEQNGHGRRQIARNASGRRLVHGRGGAVSQPRSQTRSRSPQLAAEEPPREHRRRRHASDAPRHRRAERLLPETRESLDIDNGHRLGEMEPRERTRRRDRNGSDDGQERGRRDRAHDKERDHQRKMTDTQRMMMSGMMHPAAMQMAMMQQMGHVGMMHPSYMAAMQQQQQQKMMLKRDSRRQNKQTEGGLGDDSSSDSSSDSSGPESGVLGQAAAMAAMAAMQHHWPHPASASACPPPPQALPPPPQAEARKYWRCSDCGFNNAPRNKICGGNGPMGCKAPREQAGEAEGRPPPPPPPGHPCGSDKDIEDYLKANPVEEDAADRLRALRPHLAAAVIARGPVRDSTDPTAVLLARLRAVEINRPPGEVPIAPPVVPKSVSDPKSSADNTATARRSAKSAIEKMIDDYRLSPECGWMMRALPPDKQRLVAQIDPAGQADPSGYVAEELKKIV